jgi:hypothetical protein
MRYFEKQSKLEGLYIIPNQGQLIYDNEMPFIVKARNFKNKVNIPHILLSDKKAFGVIAMRDARMFPKEEIFDTERYHPEQIAEWAPWGYKVLYEHPYEFEPFPTPLQYNYRKGVRGWDKNPRVKYLNKTITNKLKKKVEEKLK